jgi:hypothetical protein
MRLGSLVTMKKVSDPTAFWSGIVTNYNPGIAGDAQGATVLTVKTIVAGGGGFITAGDWEVTWDYAVIPPGGSTNQVLTKNGSSDFDLKWAAPSAGTPDIWHKVGTAGEPALGSGWLMNAGGPPVAFKKFPDGMVRVRGYVNFAAGDGGVVFTLPAGYRPPGTSSQYQRFSVYGNQTGNIVFVRPDGAVFCWNSFAGATDWDLSPIAFDTTP